jgi:transposase
MRHAAKIELNQEEIIRLENMVLSFDRVKIAERARIVLEAYTGKTNEDIAKNISCSIPTVSKWRTRFAKDGLEGILNEAPRSGRPATLTNTISQQVLKKTTTEAPPAEHKHWSTRLMAQAFGISPSTVSRIWRANSLKPHLIAMAKK